jgi:hypothetical protein
MNGPFRKVLECLTNLTCCLKNSPGSDLVAYDPFKISPSLLREVKANHPIEKVAFSRPVEGGFISPWSSCTTQESGEVSFQERMLACIEQIF